MPFGTRSGLTNRYLVVKPRVPCETATGGHSAASPQLSFMRDVAVRLSERGRIGTAMSASDIADFCLQEDIEMPGVSPENQTVEEGRKQIGKIMSKVLGDRPEINLGEFILRRDQEKVFTPAGNDQMLNRYTLVLAHPASKIREQ